MTISIETKKTATKIYITEWFHWTPDELEEMKGTRMGHPFALRGVSKGNRFLSSTLLTKLEREKIPTDQWHTNYGIPYETLAALPDGKYKLDEEGNLIP